MPDSNAVINGQFYDGETPGNVQVVYSSYTAPVGGVAQNGVIRMMPVKKNAKIIGIKVKFGAFGAGRTVNVGDTGNTSRFLSGGDVSAAGMLRCDALTGFFYQYTANGTIDIVVLGAAMPAGTVIEMITEYVMVQ